MIMIIVIIPDANRNVLVAFANTTIIFHAILYAGIRGNFFMIYELCCTYKYCYRLSCIIHVQHYLYAVSLRLDEDKFVFFLRERR